MAEGNWTKHTFTLNTGAKIPAIGLGTWQSKPNEVRNAVKVALQNGYRHIDTAAAYGNEHEVGQGIKDSGVPRDQIWITTKLNDMMHKDVQEGIDKSLKDLQVDYVDLYLMHWPVSLDRNDTSKVYKDWNFLDTWREIEKVLQQGKAKNIGVSNFSITNLEKLLPQTKTVPAVNQIELHPNNPSPKLLAFCKEKGIHCTAYSCLGSTESPLAKDQTLKRVAEKNNKSTQQTLLVWGLQRDTSVIPKSVTDSRIKANFDIDGYVLPKEDFESLNSLPDRFKVCDEWLPEKVFDGRDE